MENLPKNHVRKRLLKNGAESISQRHYNNIQNAVLETVGFRIEVEKLENIERGKDIIAVTFKTKKLY